MPLPRPRLAASDRHGQMMGSSGACPRFEPATVSAKSEAGFPPRNRFGACDQAPKDSSASPPETVGSRLLSLLQSTPAQTLSAIFKAAEKPNCRGLLRDRLGGSRAERYGKLLSCLGAFSPKLGAWPNYFTSFFAHDFSCRSSLLSRKVGIPFAPVGSENLLNDPKPPESLVPTGLSAADLRSPALSLLG